MNNKEKFLKAVCNDVKYRSMHKAIKAELSAHIDEAAQMYEGEGMNPKLALSKAVSDMGNPEEIGNAFNRHYAMPFNSRCGLTLWSALATGFVYFALCPLIGAINAGPRIVTHEGSVTFAILVLFALANYLILRRGHFKVSGGDIRDISLGFLTGAVVSAAVLFALSGFGKYGYYLYSDNVKILFFNRVIYYGREIRVCGYELLTWLFCITEYLIACPIKKTKGIAFAVNAKMLHSPIVKMSENEDISFNNYES